MKTKGKAILLITACCAFAAINLYSGSDTLVPTRLWNEGRKDKTLVTIANKPVTIKLNDGRTIKANIPILVERNAPQPTLKP